MTTRNGISASADTANNNGNTSSDPVQQSSTSWATTGTATPNSTVSSPRRTGWHLRSLFTSSKDKDHAKAISSVVTPDGSIKQHIWDGIGKTSSSDKRIDTFRTLQEVMKGRQFEASTLEGIWHDTKDMLTDPGLRDHFLEVITELTYTQYNQLSLALRHTFFQTIRDIGFEDLTLKWLKALSHGGENVNGFEKDMDNLMTDWMKICLSEKTAISPKLTVNILKLVNEFIIHNAAFISAATMTEMVRCVCHRAVRSPPVPKSSPLHADHSAVMDVVLDFLICVLKYRDLPQSQLLGVVTVCCIHVCDTDDPFRRKAWTLAKSLLTSKLAQRTRQKFLELLDEHKKNGQLIPQERMVLILRGSIFCLSNAFWGVDPIEPRCSPANIIPSFQIAMRAHAAICYDVLYVLRRLVMKGGRDLHHMSWSVLVSLLNEVIDLCNTDNAFESRCSGVLNEVLQLTEQLYADQRFSASPDMLFDLIEKCAQRRPDSSIVNLIQYRVENISPLQADWIERLLQLVERYTAASETEVRRLKMYQQLQSVYTKYRQLYEHEIITKLMLPILKKTSTEKCSKVQYQMINLLFDVAKNVSLKGQALLFQSVVDLAKDLLNACFNRLSFIARQAYDEGFTNIEKEEISFTDMHDNVLLIVQGIDEILEERFTQQSLPTLNLLLGTLGDHIDLHYREGWTGEYGQDVRVRALKALLFIHCNPITNRLERRGANREEDEPQVNVYVTRKRRDHPEGFSWGQICTTVTKVANTDQSGPVLTELLRNLGPVLEHIELVYTATEKGVDEMTSAIMGLMERLDDLKLEPPLSDQLEKYLPPILGTLLNYTVRQDAKNKVICKYLVESIKFDKNEAYLGCDVAIQLVPDAMESQAICLLDQLAQQSPSATRAIPLLELLSDAAEVPAVYKFFREDQVRKIVDILTPYTSVKKFNTYVVACTHRILMRWFSHLSDTNLRNIFRNRVEERMAEVPLLHFRDEMDSNGMTRQPSGDGRQVPGSMFLMGGAPDTPPPMDNMGLRPEHGPDSMFDEIQRAMQAFFRLGGRIEEDEGEPLPALEQDALTMGAEKTKQVHINGKLEPVSAKTMSKESYIECNHEHFFVNDTIFSVRTLIEKNPHLKDDESVNEVFAEPPSPTDFSVSNNFFAERRRHQSAAAHPRNGFKPSEGVMERPRALDDLYAQGGPHRKRSIRSAKVPVVAYTMLTIRHCYGRQSWLMRSFDRWPEDFDKTTAIAPSAATLLHQLVPPTQAVRVSRKDEHFYRSLKNLDYLDGIELHAVGVLYVGPGQDDEVSILGNSYGSDRYAKFIRNLGDPTDLTKCHGGLVEGKHGSYTYVYKDELSKIAFLIATLMPKLDDKCLSKKQLIANNFVVLVYNESGRAFKLGTVCGQFAYVALEIVPTEMGAVMITVHYKDDIGYSLAMKRVLVSESSAPRMLRKLIVRTLLAVNVTRSPKDAPYISLGIERLRKIEGLRKKLVGNNQPV